MTSKNILRFKIRGTSPLLMHSDRYSNPLDEMTKRHKQLTSKRKKTDEDQIAIMESEFYGSLYLNGDSRVIIPGYVVESCIRDGAKLQKMGTAFTRAATVIEDSCALDFGSGEKTPEELWKNSDFRDVRSVVVGGSRVPRCRPKFTNWKIEFSVAFHPAIIQADDIKKAVEDAGDFIGLCDYRPKYGRFEVEEVK